MYNTDLLKETYKRNNPTEQKLMCLIIDTYPDLTIIRGKNIQSVDWCAKQLKGQNVLILDAKTSNLTEKGRYRTIEFCFIHCTGKKTWIDAKQAKTTTNITDLHGEYYRAKNNMEKTLFVVEGKGYSNNVLSNHKKYLKEYYSKYNINVMSLEQIQTIIKSSNLFN